MQVDWASSKSSSQNIFEWNYSFKGATGRLQGKKVTICLDYALSIKGIAASSLDTDTFSYPDPIYA